MVLTVYTHLQAQKSTLTIMRCSVGGACKTTCEKNPNDPDNKEIQDLLRKEKENYLRWGRDTMGWATYLFGKP